MWVPVLDDIMSFTDMAMLWHQAWLRLLCGKLTEFSLCRYVERRLMQEEHASLEQEHERLQARMRELETLAATAGE